MFDFSNIDEATQNFRKGKYGVYISRKAKSDWFVFQYLSIEWKKGKLNFIIEIFPDLDDEGNSISWNYMAMVHFDENKERYGAKYDFIRSSSFKLVDNLFTSTIEEKYNYLNSLQETEIDFSITPLSHNF